MARIPPITVPVRFVLDGPECSCDWVTVEVSHSWVPLHRCTKLDCDCAHHSLASLQLDHPAFQLDTCRLCFALVRSDHFDDHLRAHGLPFPGDSDADDS